MLGYIGLILGLIIVAYTVYRGWNIALAVFFGCVSFVLLCGVGVMDAINAFFTAWGGFATSFLGKMFFSAVFAKLYEVSGAGTSIAMGIARLLFRENTSRRTRVMLCFLVGIICQFILVFGGIGPVLCIFMTVPIFFPLMEQADIPRRYGVPALIVGALVLGNVAAGAPTNGNVMIVNLLDGTAMDGFLSSTIVLVCELIACLVILTSMAMKAMERGEHFEYGPTFKPVAAAERPHVLLALVPMIIVVILFAGFQWDVRLALLVAIPAGILLFWKWLAVKPGTEGNRGRFLNMRVWASAAIVSTLSPLNGMAATSGLAAVMKLSPSYEGIMTAVQSWNMNPYILTAILTMAMCFIVAGNATSMNIALPIVRPIAEASGASLPAIGRLSAVAGSTFDTLPYSGTLNMFNSYCDCTMKETYGSVFITSVLVPMAGTVLQIVLNSIGIV